MLLKEKMVRSSQVMTGCCKPTTSCRSGRGLRATSAAQIRTRTRRSASTIRVILDFRMFCKGDVRRWLRSSSFFPREGAVQHRGRRTSGTMKRQRHSSVATSTLVLLAPRRLAVERGALSLSGGYSRLELCFSPGAGW
ncbi:hypothetical protein MRX96_009115 [Rhipicephalus microplus]